MTKTKTYRTRDTNLAAFLLASQGLLPRLEVSDGVVWFSYDVPVSNHRDHYFSGATIPALQYAQAIREVRSLIRKALDHAERKEGVA